jgi:crotonobetainyl-CoA:carnitine CoA-transferase CaiB-like acyl-CoA transferase
VTALKGYKILELAEGVAGEYGARLLADFGADVIKIERPGIGSPTRHMGPFGQGDVPGETSGLFAYLNTNKHSVELDLSSDEGRALLLGLLDRVDVVIDDHDDGWLRKLGLDPDTFLDRWPGLILVSITPYGRHAPEERTHATDFTVMHSSGWGYHTPGGGQDERPPLKGPGRFLASYESGMDAGMCIAAALYEREANGRGRFIDLSMHEVMASRTDYVLAQFVIGEMNVGDERGAFDLGGPGGIFPCQDGFIYIFMSTPQHWQAYRELIGNPAWTEDYPERWLDRGLTPERIAHCRAGLVDWLATRGKDEASAQAQALGITLVPINDARDILASPQYAHRGYFREVEHPVLGKALYPTVPWAMSETPAAITAPAPLLGQHNDALEAGR